MKKINKTRYAILGMLTDQPQSGYDIKRAIMGSVAHFWQESDASIYPTLKVLEKEGLVTATREHVGKRARVIFAITPAGKKELVAWLAIPAQNEPHRSEFLLKLFFSANTNTQDTVTHLTIHQKRVTAILEEFKHIEEGLSSHIPDDNPHKIYWTMTLRNGIMQAKTELRWIADCLNLLNANRKKSKK